MKLVGKLEDLGLGEILQIISFSRKSGVLWINGELNSGYISFEDGLIIRASSTLVKRSIGPALVKAGDLTAEALANARAEQKAGGYKENLGTLLVRSYGISEDSLGEEARKIVEKSVYAFFRSHEGSFIFELKELEETPEMIMKDKLQCSLTEGMNPQFLAMEGSRLTDEAAHGTLDEDDDEDEGEDDVDEDVEVAFDIEDAAETAPAPPLTDESQTLTGDFLKEMEADGLVTSSEPVEELEETKGLMLLKEMLEELSRPLTMSEIVLLVLRFSSELMTRAVVFSIKKGNVVGLGQFGIDVDGVSADKMVRKMKIPLSEDSILKRAIESMHKVVGPLDDTEWNGHLLDQIGGTRPKEAFVAPVIVRGKVAIILYADNLPEVREIGDTSSLEIFLSQASIALERIVLRKQVAGENSAEQGED